MKEKATSLGKFHERRNGARYININKGGKLPFNDKQSLKLKTKGKRVYIESI